MKSTLLSFFITLCFCFSIQAQKKIEIASKSAALESDIGEGLMLTVSGIFDGTEVISVSDLNTGTATLTTDYTFSSPKNVTIPAGTYNNKTISIPNLVIVNDDIKSERTETINFSISLPIDVTAADVDGDGSIRTIFSFPLHDDDEDIIDTDTDGISDVDELANGFNPNLAGDWSYNVELLYGNNTNTNNRILIGMLPEGYTKNELDTFESDINTTINYLFKGLHPEITNNANNPYVRYANFFNLYAIKFASTESGIDVPQNSKYVKTAFSCRASDRLIGGTLYNKALDVIEKALTQTLGVNPVTNTEYSVVRSILHNQEIYANVALGNLCVVSKKYNTMIYNHETAHAWHGLPDTYDYGSDNPTYTGPEPTEPNLTKDITGAKWSRWMGYNNNLGGIGPVGVFEGAKYKKYGIYRPTFSSIMRSINDYDAIEREAIILNIYDKYGIKPLDSYTTVKTLNTHKETFTANVIDPAVIKLKWYVNDVLVDNDGNNTLNYDWASETEGTHILKAVAYDEVIDFSNYQSNGYSNTNPHPLDLVRKDLDKLKQEIVWQVFVSKNGAESGGFEKTNYLANEPIIASIFTENLNNRLVTITCSNGDQETVNFVSNGYKLVAQINTDVKDPTPNDGKINIGKFDINKTISFQLNNSPISTNISVLDGLKYSFDFEDNIDELTSNETTSSIATTYVTRDNECGKNSKAFTLNNNNYITFNNVNLQSILGGSSTLSFYIKSTTAGSQYSWQTSSLYGYKDGSASNDFNLGWFDLNGKLRASTGAWSIGAGSTTTLNNGTWNHVIISRNSITGEFKIYVNGILEGSFTGATGDFKAYTINCIGLRNNVQQNVSPTVVNSRPAFPAEIDRLRIFTKTLTDTEATAVYNIDKNCKTNQAIIPFKYLNLLTNPTYGLVEIKLDASEEEIFVDIFSSLGQKIKSETFKNVDYIATEIVGESGIYFLNIYNKKNIQQVLKIIKKQ